MELDPRHHLTFEELDHQARSALYFWTGQRAGRRFEVREDNAYAVISGLSHREFDLRLLRNYETEEDTTVTVRSVPDILGWPDVPLSALLVQRLMRRG
jgi:hypothetical protein